MNSSGLFCIIYAVYSMEFLKMFKGPLKKDLVFKSEKFYILDLILLCWYLYSIVKYYKLLTYRLLCIPLQVPKVG